MLACASVSFGPASWTSLCGMMSLFTKRSVVPFASVTLRFGASFALANCHMWQPRISWLMVIFAVLPAAAGVTAASAATAASHVILLSDIVFLLSSDASSVGRAR